MKNIIFMIVIINQVLYQIVQCNTTVRSLNLITNQDIQKILQNIEERLQVIDKIERKIDNISTRINRLENTFDSRLEKIDSNINIKHEHIARKVDTIYDRHIHRLENKFEKELAKIENKIETNLHRLERIENNFSSRQEFIEAEIGENSEILKDIQLSIDILQDNSKIENSTKTDLNNKLFNMEKLINENIYMVNSTKKECQDNARTINTLNRKTTNLNQNLSNDINKLLNGIGGMIQKKFLHVNQKIDSNFNNTMLAHNYFLESCHRIQLEEPQMEAKIVNVVETLLSLITNKTMIMGGEIYYLQDLLRTHDTEIQNKVGLAKNTLLEMAQKSFTYKQETVQTLLEMKNNLNQWLNYTADILNNNKTDHYEKLNAIEQTLQNVHNYIINLNVSKNREIELNANKLIEYIEKNINTTNFNTSNKMEQHFENINSFLNKIHDKIVEKQSPINLRHNRSKNTTQLIKNGTHDTTLEPQQHSKKFNESELIIGNLNDATSIVDLDVDFNYSTDLIEDDTEDIDFTY